MEVLSGLSGIIAIVVTWMLVVAPAVRTGMDGSRQSISSTTCDVAVGRTVSLGLIVGTVFQVIFLFHLSRKFGFGLWSPGAVLFLSTCVSSFLVAFVPEHRYAILHNILVKYYFVAHPVSLLLISGYPGIPWLSAFTIADTLLYYLGTGWILMRYGICAHAENWAFLMLSAWTIAATFA